MALNTVDMHVLLWDMWNNDEINTSLKVNPSDIEVLQSNIATVNWQYSWIIYQKKPRTKADLKRIKADLTLSLCQDDSYPHKKLSEFIYN